MLCPNRVIDEDRSAFFELLNGFRRQIMNSSALAATCSQLLMPLQIGNKALSDVFALRNDMHAFWDKALNKRQQ